MEHRIEFVRELDGVKWYNDSIASNPTRTIAGLYSFNQKLCIIAGGYDKKIPFEPLADPVAERVKLLILTGPTADKIEAAVKASPKYDPGSVPDSPGEGSARSGGTGPAGDCPRGYCIPLPGMCQL